MDLIDKRLTLRVEAGVDRMKDVCHIFDGEQCLGILPASKITTVMDYSEGLPRTIIEILAQSFRTETLAPPKEKDNERTPR